MVQKIRADFEENGTFLSQPKKLSLKKHTEKDNQHLYISSRIDAKKSVVKLINEYNSTVDKKSTINWQTVSYILRKRGLFSQSFKKKLSLSKKNIRGRRQFYSKHKNYKLTD